MDHKILENIAPSDLANALKVFTTLVGSKR
jgi:hypothetical protein